MHFEVKRARALFAEGFRLLPMLDRRSGACVAAMAGIYHRLLTRIAADPEAVLRGRVSLPGREKAFVAVRGLSGLDARGDRPPAVRPEARMMCRAAHDGGDSASARHATLSRGGLRPSQAARGEST